MHTYILVIGRNEPIVSILEKAINKWNHFTGYSCIDDEKAIEIFHQHPIDIVLLSSGILPSEERKLRALFLHQNKNIVIVQHYGGGTGLLENEIRQVIDQMNQSHFKLIDQ